MVGRNDTGINAGLKEIIQIVQAVAQGSSVYYIAREGWLVLQTCVNSSYCRRCNATGRVICNKCQGSGTLRRRPAAFSTLADEMVNHKDDFYKCPYSGPRGTFDIPPTADQLEDATSYRVHLAETVEKLVKKAALSRVPARPFKALAGTRVCPDCDGEVRVKGGLLSLSSIFSTGGRIENFAFPIKKCPELYEDDQMPLSIRRKAAPLGGPMHITEYPNPSPQLNTTAPEGFEDRANRLKALLEREKSKKSNSSSSKKYRRMLEKELKQVKQYAVEIAGSKSKGLKRDNAL
jgi:hypothetical protein